MNQLGKNILSNFGMQLMVLLSQLVLLPFYVHLLGVEAYAWIGIYVSLQGLFVMLDLGMSTTINQEMARLSGDEGSKKEASHVLKTFELSYWMIGLFIFVLVYFLVPLITSSWEAQISASQYRSGILWIAILVVLRFPVSFYMGALNGMQQQFNMNVLLILLEILKFAGIVIGIRCIYADILLFFWVNIAIGILTIAGLRYLAIKVLGKGWGQGRFEWEYLRRNWRFSLGVSIISLAAVAVSQMDKILLGKLVSMHDFSLYTLAFSIAALPTRITGSIASAFYPLFVREKSNERIEQLITVYHRSCQAISIIILPAVIISILFMPELLTLWFGNKETADNLVPLVRVLMLGFCFNGLVTMPYYLQLAFRWTRLSVYKNLIALVILLPGLYLSVLGYGISGAVWIWFLLNLFYFVLEIPVMHGRILRSEITKYYTHDTGWVMLLSALISFGFWFLLHYWTIHDFVLLLLLMLLGVGQVILLNNLSTEKPLRYLFFRNENSAP
ncbi:MAG: oligosaccharide flippase family protein [Saprospiraceae bacterium]|nr:oligosaccharide flippase family protein [Saprospiraceae bacterium]HMW40302.1 oligosaccharide flippase family protein [Saprospiraceae bacterium]HMX87740.1 oligosaccharide flippase family protein [Saprospiraceae bacterium]HMZ39316.1 oligosaccharide flippase family protein [Saprospiraceae bacterium]HNA63632.1 oligosaccharide flippase family protein [Saprospiraceae bacterium]